MLTNAPKGTKDILPEQVGKWQYIERVFREVSSKYSFREIRTPIFEHTELFKRGIGDTTDVVQKEMYTFEDLAERSLTLKPEGTASTVRAFVENKQYAEIQPTKYYYITPCFRYEKPQAGRYREFHQLGVELFGTPNMMADAAIVALAYDFFNELGLTDFEIRINSVGCPECRKVYRDTLKSFFEPKLDELCNLCNSRYETNPMRIIDCKNEHCKELVKDAPLMIDYLCEECKKSFDEVQENLNSFEVPFIIDPKIVRGLDYYTKTAFEIVTDKIGSQSTICGGGRYDNLIEDLGGPPIPGVGMAIGIERLIMLMENSGLEFSEPNVPDAFIVFIGDETKSFALRFAHNLRHKGVKIEIDALGRNVKGQFKYADRVNAKYTIIIGEDEIKRGVVNVKDMQTGEQVELETDKVAEFLLK